MYCIEATTPEMREQMNRQQMGLELIRMKRNIPVTTTDGMNPVFGSLSEAAEYLHMRPQVISRQLQRARDGKRSSFREVLDWEPYVDLSACTCVDEYILHYIRIYYPELYESSLHCLDKDQVEEHLKFCDTMNVQPVIEIRDGWYYDLLTDEAVREI